MPSIEAGIRGAQVVQILRACSAEDRVEVFSKIADAFCTKCGKLVEENCGCTEDDKDDGD